jgi:multiple sugar transport system permease protein
MNKKSNPIEISQVNSTLVKVSPWRLSWGKLAARRYLLFIILVAPAFLLRISTAAYPILQTIYLGFTNLNILGGTNEFVGLENYLQMPYDYGVRGAFTFTVIFVLASTILNLVIGLLVALLLNASFSWRPFARTINLIPWAIPTIVAGYLFRWILDDQFGMIPHWVYITTGERMVALISPWGARISVILVQVWKEAPFMAIVFLAGLQGIPEELYDAAIVDGANIWQRFWRITIPLVAPLVITLGMFRIVWSLANFDLIFGLTFGGPGVATSVLSLRIFQEGILFFKFGFASAISVVLLILVGITGLIALRLFRRYDVSY